MGKKERAKEKKEKKAKAHLFQWKRLSDHIAARSMIRSYQCDEDVDWEKVDFGQYGDHKEIRPYQNIGEGIEWYMIADPKIPDFMYLPIVAKNFGITEKEAKTRLLLEVNKTTLSFE